MRRVGTLHGNIVGHMMWADNIDAIAVESLPGPMFTIFFILYSHFVLRNWLKVPHQQNFLFSR
jgi:hypothetical protein